MNIIVKLPVEIPEETINELVKRAAEELANDERDLVDVIRCKDCLHCKYLGIAYDYCYCLRTGISVEEEDFCSYGEESETK